MKHVNNVYPVIKWAGGKRQLIPIIEENMPRTFNSARRKNSPHL